MTQAYTHPYIGTLRGEIEKLKEQEQQHHQKVESLTQQIGMCMYECMCTCTLQVNYKQVHKN